MLTMTEGGILLKAQKQELTGFTSSVTQEHLADGTEKGSTEGCDRGSWNNILYDRVQSSSRMCLLIVRAMGQE